MSHDGYQALFDLTARPYNPEWGAISVAAFAVVMTILFAFANRKRLWAATMSAAIGLFLFTTSAWTAWDYHLEDQELRHAIKTSAYSIAEGVVQDFRADPPGGNVPQTFLVDGHRFEVRSRAITPAFKETVGSGGPDLSGRCVRILYVSDVATSTDRIVWLGASTCPDGD